MKPVDSVHAGLGTTIFEEMSRRARETGAVDLGQGFPDDPGPLDVRERAARAVDEERPKEGPSTSPARCGGLIGLLNCPHGAGRLVF